VRLQHAPHLIKTPCCALLPSHQFPHTKEKYIVPGEASLKPVPGKGTRAANTWRWLLHRAGCVEQREHESALRDGFGRTVLNSEQGEGGIWMALEVFRPASGAPTSKNRSGCMSPSGESFAIWNIFLTPKESILHGPWHKSSSVLHLSTGFSCEIRQADDSPSIERPGWTVAGMRLRACSSKSRRVTVFMACACMARGAPYGRGLFSALSCHLRLSVACSRWGGGRGWQEDPSVLNPAHV
jgi:hypothetical protein